MSSFNYCDYCALALRRDTRWRRGPKAGKGGSKPSADFKGNTAVNEFLETTGTAGGGKWYPPDTVPSMHLTTAKDAVTFALGLKSICISGPGVSLAMPTTCGHWSPLASRVLTSSAKEESLPLFLYYFYFCFASTALLLIGKQLRCRTLKVIDGMINKQTRPSLRII